MKKKYKRNHELLDGKMKGVDPIQQLITLEVVAPGISQAQSSLGTQTLQGQLGILPATGKKSQGIFLKVCSLHEISIWIPDSSLHELLDNVLVPANNCQMEGCHFHGNLLWLGCAHWVIHGDR